MKTKAMPTSISVQPLEILSQLLSEGQVITHPVELIPYERDGTLVRGRPQAVVLPHSLDDVVRVVRWAAEHHVPLVARGAGTGLSGGAVADEGGVIVSFARMRNVLALDRVGGLVITQPGVTNQTLDETVKKLGLYFPPDPSSGRSATIGGNIAENSGGPHCFKYGVTTNYINGLEVVLHNGHVLRLGGAAVDYPGYDFISLFTGSEGTLGLITAATLRLMRNPPAVKTMMAAFDSVEEASNAVSAVIACGLMPATMEMMDQKMMRIIEDYVHVGLPVEAGAALIIEVDGYPESLDVQMDEVVNLLRQQNARELRVTQTPEEREKLWYGRKSAFGAIARLAPSYYVLDGTVPRSRLGTALVGVDRICNALNLRVANVFHAGDGNLHPLVLIEDPNDHALLERVHEAGRQIMQLCLELGGSITGEHGVGIEKRAYMALMYDHAALSAMWDIKHVFDPDRLFNPGKVLPLLPAVAHPAEAPISSSASDTPYAPTSAEEVAQALHTWMADGRAVYIRGAGSKFTPPQDEGIAVLTTHALCGISTYALEDLYVTVRAGTPLAELQAELSQDGMWVPLVSPWPISTLGGIMASNFNAPLRIRYGAIRDLVLAATMVLPDGRTIRIGRPVVKNVAGYDLHRLFVGSYGTLGVITEATLRLYPLPRARVSLLIPCEELSQALRCASELLPICLIASALLICHRCPASIALEGERITSPYMVVYTAEGVPEDVRAELHQARTALQSIGVSDVWESTQWDGNTIWAHYLADITSGTPADLVRVGVGRKDLPQLLTTLDPFLHEHPYCADIAVGLLYVPGGATRLLQMERPAIEMGGYAILPTSPCLSIHGEPGCSHAPESWELMRRLKACWDAHGLLNPGLLFPR
ncbi:MAG: FAD-binding oxidoreductase [Anaerolineae bacterium]